MWKTLPASRTLRELSGTSVLKPPVLLRLSTLDFKERATLSTIVLKPPDLSPLSTLDFRELGRTVPRSSQRGDRSRLDPATWCRGRAPLLRCRRVSQNRR